MPVKQAKKINGGTRYLTRARSLPNTPKCTVSHLKDFCLNDCFRDYPQWRRLNHNVIQPCIYSMDFETCSKCLFSTKKNFLQTLKCSGEIWFQHFGSTLFTFCLWVSIREGNSIRLSLESWHLGTPFPLGSLAFCNLETAVINTVGSIGQSTHLQYLLLSSLHL